MKKIAPSFWFLLALGLLTASGSIAQPATLPLQSPAHHLLDRLDISSGTAAPMHLQVRPVSRQDAVAYALLVDSVANTAGKYSAGLRYLYDENNEWLSPGDSLRRRLRRKPVLGIFFRTPANLFEVNTPAFRLRVNPMAQLAAGQEQNESAFLFVNQRGVEVRGDVDGRVYFYSHVLESQVRFPNYVNQWVAGYQSVPGAGFYKPYNSGLFNVKNGYDFNLANAYIGARITRHISLQFGHGQHFIGNGYRSLWLSDAGNYAYYLKFSTRVWRLHYQNLFLELHPISTAVPRPPNSLLPKKYVAAHYLSFRPAPAISIGFFEATVLNRSRQFELQYLNPVILYRTVEGMIGSPDNVLIGFDGRWNFLRRFQVYGQLLIDEFLFSALYKPEQKGWWGNKFGWQAGIKYIDAFQVPHLDIQLEYNTVRPYTYSSFDSLNSYTHYHQALAHPLLANFNEWIGLVRYQPHPRVWLSGRLMYAKTGEDSASENWGNSPLLQNGSRVRDYGNFTGQGVQSEIFLAGLDAAWQLYHNLYFECRVLLRHKNSADDNRDLETRLFNLGIRWNVWNRNLDF
ncbi:MAG: hypothetical protein IPM81_12110 [Saprospirales bacterium]|nr:hypothetical protein [Saprospirales bacterium]